MQKNVTITPAKIGMHLNTGLLALPASVLRCDYSKCTTQHHPLLPPAPLLPPSFNFQVSSELISALDLTLFNALHMSPLPGQQRLKL